MTDKNIGFIGAGNMAHSLIGGLMATGMSPEKIWISDKNQATLQALKQQFKVNTCPDNQALIQHIDVLILAVKPQQLAEVCHEIASETAQKPVLVISIAAGITTSDIARWLEKTQDPIAIVRCMPNTPALVQSGATALYATDAVDDAQRALAESILRATGLTLWLEQEQDMDAVTALSGSGPAYIFLVIEAMEKAGAELGLNSEQAHLLATQTVFGAAKMALESQDNAEVLRQKVTSPGGTTEQAIQVLQQGHLENLFYQAMLAAKNRSEELAQLLGKSNA